MTLWRRRIDGRRVSSTLVFLSTSLDIEFNLCFIPTKLLSGDDLFFFSDLLSALTGDFSRPDWSLSFFRVWLLRSFFFLSFFRLDEVVLSSSPEEDLNPGLASSSETFRWRLCSIYTKHDDKLHYHCLVCHSSTIILTWRRCRVWITLEKMRGGWSWFTTSNSPSPYLLGIIFVVHWRSSLLKCYYWDFVLILSTTYNINNIFICSCLNQDSIQGIDPWKTEITSSLFS